MSSRRGKTPDPFLSSASSSSATMRGNAGNNSNRTWLIVLIIIAVVILWLFNDSKSTPMPAPMSQATCPSLGALRTKALSASNGKFKSDLFDAVSAKQRESALGQKGATMWMTGLSGSGKSTIGKELERRLVLNDKVHMYRLDGDNMRFGLSRDLKLTPEDRKEAVRRAGEVASLMADSGTLTLVSLISPYQRDRDAARTLHEEKGLAFLEVYVEAPTSEVEKRDPKGLYKSHREGKLRGVTGFDAPYEAPAHPEILLKTQECCGDHASEQKLSVCKTEADAAGTKFQAHCPKALDECVGACVDKLRSELIRLQVVQPKAGQSAAIAAAPATPCVREVQEDARPGPAKGHADGYPDGTVPPAVLEEHEEYWVSDAVTKLQPVPLGDVEVQWVQVIGEGWAAPLKGPMRESALVQALHFNSLLVEKTGMGGESLYGPGPSPTDFGNSDLASKMVKNGQRVSMPVPIVIPVNAHTKMLIARKIKQANGGRVQVVLVSPAGEPVAVLNNPEVYPFRKEEMITRSWGSWDMDHPYVKENILEAGDFLLGGELEKVRRIKFRDGLDKWRLTPQELVEEFRKKDAEGVFAFQTRNPTHAGHAHLMKDGREQLKKRGYKNPVLWLSPLGGWTKDDDVPLDVRVKQHQAVLDEKMLDPAWTVLAIWPSPMVYSGPTEVQWHAKSRRVAGADFFIVGRDPAGLAYSKSYVKEHNITKNDDVYDADHGRYVLQVSPGMGNLGLLASGAVHYDKTDGEMKPRPKGMSDVVFDNRFLKISGSKMRKMGKMMVDICPSLDEIPAKWSKDPSCVPPKFMVPTGWEIMKHYYKNKDQPEVKENAVLQSKQRPAVAENAEAVFPTKVGTKAHQYAVYLKNEAKERISPWHDVPLKVGDVYNMVVEIPKGTNSKFEVMKELPHNPIKQDKKKGLPRYYSYGMAFFNNGLFPQTWEDSSLKEEGYFGDNDPLDVMEVGQAAYPIGSVVPVKVLGSLGMIDSDELDHKIITIALADPDASKIKDIDSLREVKGSEFVERIVDWLRRYKTTDKDKPDTAAVNTFLKDAQYQSVQSAVDVIEHTHKRWKLLREGKVDASEKTKDFWLGKTA